ncbi:MAG: squalene/phytoene synthase family protein [Myxococcota bacterium]
MAGAGPAGIAVAAGYARQGRRVLLAEANPKASSRFAGEWIHPAGAAALERLGLSADAITAGHPACEGFAVFPDDGTDPVQLHYADGALGFTCEHADLVGELREQVNKIAGVHLALGVRVTSIDGHEVTLCGAIDGEKKAARTVHADLIVGADGRSSAVRKSVYGDQAADVLSHMAGLELEDVELPHEGFGHVLLGGPGPVLLYRISPTRVRACIDVPAGHPGSRRDARYLWEAFGARFPASLRAAFRRTLETARVTWACNRFLPRTHYGKGHVALVGDAVGFYHPLTASGITIGLKDADALVRSESVEAYGAYREPRSWTPELLANALLHVFNRDDEAAVEIRSAVYRTWRSSRTERDRTMRILAGDELRMGQFGQAFVRVAGEAARATVTSGNMNKLGKFIEFAQWPAASVLPASLRRRWREGSSAFHPMAAAGLKPAAPARPEVSVDAGPKVDVDALLARAPAPSSRRTESAEVLRGRALELTAALADFSDGRRAMTLREAAEHARELAEALRAQPGLRARAQLRALRPLQSRLAERQQSDGSFGDLADTAAAVEASFDAGMAVYHPRMRRAFRYLASKQRADGSFGPDGGLVLRALLRTGAPYMDAIERGLAYLTGRDDLTPAVAEAGGLYRDARASRIQPLQRARRNGKVSAEDEAYCHSALLAVSRSFARPIEMLEGALRPAVTCGYLLCRIADTIEDNAGFTIEQRDVRYAAFLDALYGDEEAARRFERLFEGVEEEPVEADLARHLATVMRVFRTLPEAMQRKASRWVAEMVRGMQIYSHRQPGDDGFTAVHTTEDLERYCFFVAGTVGHMLTDLFVEGFDAPNGKLEHALRKNAEGFGLGLQLVNILKDVTDDRVRGVSYVPRTAAAEQGIDLLTLTDLDKRERAHAAVAPLFDRAQAHLDRALEYTLTIPSEQRAVRLFCLLPLWMAVRTLVHGRGNDAMFTPGVPVKIARQEVEALIAECVARAGDDLALRAHYDQLWKTAPEARASTQASAAAQ